MRNGTSLHSAKSIQDDHGSCKKSIFYSFFRSTISPLRVQSPWLSCFPSAPAMLPGHKPGKPTASRLPPPASHLLLSSSMLRPTPTGEQLGMAEASLGKIKLGIRDSSPTLPRHISGSPNRLQRALTPMRGDRTKLREGQGRREKEERRAAGPRMAGQRGEPLGGGIRATTPQRPPILTGH